MFHRIVRSTRGRSGRQRLVAGGLGSRRVHQAQGAVLLVRPRATVASRVAES